MLKRFRRNKKKTEELPKSEQAQPMVAESPAEQPQQKKGLFNRLRQGLRRTSGQLAGGVANAVLGKKQIDDDLLEELETQLLLADVGVDATQSIIKDLTEKVKRKQLNDGQALLAALKQELQHILLPCQQPLAIPQGEKPYVILMVGINGAGKTTSIGKIAKRLQQDGRKVMLAAGDTFRAAAVEQLQVWGERNDIAVIAQQSGADSGAVIFDALQAATARGADVLIADTAGRLHTQHNLMEELKKVKRVLAKLDPEAPHEVMLVLDASVGQNALQQAKQFQQAVDISGITITKLDGTAKGGIIFAIAKQLNIPIRYIGVGESIDDLRPFVAEEFVAALFSME